MVAGAAGEANPPIPSLAESAEPAPPRHAARLQARGGGGGGIRRTPCRGRHAHGERAPPVRRYPDGPDVRQPNGGGQWCVTDPSGAAAEQPLQCQHADATSGGLFAELAELRKALGMMLALCLMVVLGRRFVAWDHWRQQAALPPNPALLLPHVKVRTPPPPPPHSSSAVESTCTSGPTIEPTHRICCRPR